MLFGPCNCYPGALSISRRRLLCGGGAGFVSALYRHFIQQFSSSTGASPILQAGGCLNFALLLSWKALVPSQAAVAPANRLRARASQPSPQRGSTVEQERGNAEPFGDSLPT